MQRLLTAREVAEILRININSVYIWARAGRLPRVKVGDNVRFKEEDIERFINREKENDETTARRTSEPD